MYSILKDLEFLTDAFNTLPGIGKKSAAKLACFVLEQNEEFVHKFCQQLKSARTNIHKCSRCNNYVAHDDLCQICTDPLRDSSKLCIVSNYLDLVNLENSMSFNGYYYILGKELSWKDIQQGQINLQKLFKMINGRVKEITMATNLTPSGILTADYLFNVIKNFNSEIDIFRIGFGLPINSSIDYADELTLKHAMENKQLYKKE